MKKKKLILSLGTSTNWDVDHVMIEINPDLLKRRVAKGIAALNELDANALDYYWYATGIYCDEEGYPKPIRSEYSYLMDDDEFGVEPEATCNLHVSRDGDFCFIIQFNDDDGGEAFTDWLTLEDLESHEKTTESPLL